MQRGLLFNLRAISLLDTPSSNHTLIWPFSYRFSCFLICKCVPKLATPPKLSCCRRDTFFATDCKRAGSRELEKSESQIFLISPASNLIWTSPKPYPSYREPRMRFQRYNGSNEIACDFNRALSLLSMDKDLSTLWIDTLLSFRLRTYLQKFI